tara:strand:- start:1123 stop:2052 length:930 start_codon:yes stop_codon:yes gene_type:complete
MMADPDRISELLLSGDSELLEFLMDQELAYTEPTLDSNSLAALYANGQELYEDSPILGKLKFEESGFKQELENRLFAGEGFDNIAKDLFGREIKKQYGEYDFKLPYENFIDLAEEGFNDLYDFKYKDDLINVLQSDNPRLNVTKRLKGMSNNFINDILGQFNKSINLAPNTNVRFKARKLDDGDYKGDLDFRYSDKGKYGNVDLRSRINELGDTANRINYSNQWGPFSVGASKQSGRDPRGYIRYDSPSVSVGNARTIRANALIDDMLNARAGLEYIYDNPNTGWFVNTDLGLSSRRGPEFNLKFGKRY